MSEAAKDTMEASLTNIVLDALERILADQCTKEVIDAAEAGTPPTALWDTLEASGMPRACAPEALGGAGLTLADGFALLRAAGRHALPAPLADTIAAHALLAGAGAEALPNGMLALALDADASANAGADAGVVRAVPFAPWAEQIVVVRADEAGRAQLALVQGELTNAATNLAGDPIADLRYDAPGQWLDAGIDFADVEAMLATGRALMMAGALESVLALSTGYALEREQFGRPIARFQAVQQQLAVLAGEVAAAMRAADAAREALTTPRTVVEAAVAKARCGEAAGVGARIAHQVHGAMGFTHEHRLHQRTRRLWAWRDEYGSEARWQAELGRRIAGHGADALWQYVCAEIA